MFCLIRGRYDIDDRAVHFYLDFIDEDGLCIQFTASRQFVVSDLQPVSAVAYDYYEPSVRAGATLRPGSDLLVENLNPGSGHEDRGGLLCKAGTLRDGQKDTGEPCRCTDAANCQSCAGATPGVCLKCRNSMLLFNGACVSAGECPEGYAHLGRGKYDQQCRKPHRCVAGMDETGKPCSCSTLNRCADCIVTAGKNQGVCTACTSDFLVKGRCSNKATCTGEAVENSDIAETCSCSDNAGGSGRHCRSCTVYADGTAATCLSCRNGKYFHNGACEGECPTNLAQVHIGSSAHKRACHAPLTCHKGKVSTRGHEREGKACRCVESKVCQTCEFGLDRSIVPGTQCTRCKKKKFLHKGQCLEACPADLAHHGLRKYGRECATPFSCVKRKHAVTGAACQCPGKCHSCDLEAGNQAGAAKCTRCYSRSSLHGSTCVSECPEGTAKVKTANGNVCL